MNSKRWLKKSLFIFLVFEAVSGHAMGSGEGQPPLPSSLEEGKGSIKTILEKPSVFENKVVIVEGFFRGWSGRCKSGPPKSRSDWMLEDDTGCVYITGQIPNGLSPFQPKGEQLSVKGKVLLDKNHRPFLEAIKITFINATPQGTVE